MGTVNVLIKADTENPRPPVIEALGDGSVRVTFSGVPGQAYVIQGAPSVAPVEWQDLSSETADPFGILEWIDWPLTNGPTRFFQSVSP